MTEQDAESESDPAGTDEPATDEAPRGDEDQLSEFAEEPDEGADAALHNILGGGDEESATTEDDGEESVEELAAKIEETDPETVAEGIKLLRAEVEKLDTELADEHARADDLESRLKRKQADFQNYKKRQEQRVEDEIARATEDLVERLLDVRDNLERALEQDEGADIRGGVESTLDQFDREFEKENVEPIQPAEGEELDPTKHEALATIAGETPEGTIAEVHRPGYEMAGKILRPAQVAVSDGSGYDGESEE